jgi:hypothetical protein
MQTTSTHVADRAASAMAMTSDRAGVAAVGLFCVLAVVSLVPVLLRLPLSLEMPNEGWNAIHAMRAFGVGLYPNPHDGIVNNYPPLWHYLTGALAIAFGDPIFPGRIVALASYAGMVMAAVALTRALAASWVASALAGSWLAAVLAGQFSQHVGISEPQMLASALVVGATAASVASRSRGAAATAALLMVLGGFVKHIVIALPLATLVWLAIYRRSLFGIWLAVALSTCCAGLAALIAGYGTSVIANLGVPRVLSFHRLGTNLALSSRAIIPIASFGWLLGRISWRSDPAIAFALFALSGGFLEILLFGAALGVSENIAIDLMIVSAITLAVVWDRAAALVRTKWKSYFHLALMLALLIRLIPAFPSDGLVLLVDRGARSRFYEQQIPLLQLRDRLRMVSGPVICEHLAICIWAGHLSVVDLWKLRFERTLQPVVDTEAVLAGIAHGQFAAITLFGRHSGPPDDHNLPGLSGALAACCTAPIYFGASTLYLRRADVAR